MAEFDENVQAVADESTAAETTETTENVDNASESQEDANTIPPELEGIDDDEIVKEVMAEAKGIPIEELEPKEEPADPAAPSAIPYVRFKEKVDEGKAKDAEIAELKKQIEAFKKQQTPQYQAPAPQAQPTPQPPQQGVQAPFQLNKENIDLINKAINEQAQAMAQLSKEDMDSLEYMEDDDPRKQRWDYAKEMAKGQIFDRIRQAQAMRVAQAQRFLQAQQQSIADFNAYAQQASQEPDFEQVKDYAINEFFGALPTQRDKEIITQAYARVERNSASPEDMYLIKNYFAQAKAAYRAQHPVKAPKQTSTKNEQVTFPRSGQVTGAGDASGGVTVASLEKMLNEMPFDEIDPKYQKMLLGE